MNQVTGDLEVTIDIQPGERLTLPPEFVEQVGPGRWVVTVQPLEKANRVRLHDGFLSSYAPEDEGLYDDLPR